MSKKIVAKFFGFVMAFLCCVGGHVFAYKPLAVTQAVDTANRNRTVRYMFTDGIFACHISRLLGICNDSIHTVHNYCEFLGCTENDLVTLLDGRAPAGDGTISDGMIADFMRLSWAVREQLRQQR